jgi:choline dehydrogenase-like flavoprotein
MILDTATVDRDVSLTTEVCIVGSGAGGAVAARELAERGRSVVVVEAGPYVCSADFTQREEQMLPLLYVDQGLRTTVDSTVVVCQASVVGGSTVPSFCLCVRLPRQVLAHWRSAFGLTGLRWEEIVACFERVAAAAHVHPLLAADVNKNNAKLKSGADRLGFHNYLPLHNRIDCVGCGYCALGCVYDRKGDALTEFLPAASRHGAIIIPSCRVEHVEVRDGRAVGVRGTCVRNGTPHSVTVRAETVVLAAGAIESPALWLRSQLPNTYRQVGRNLHLHPEVVIGAVFDEEITGWHGIPQSVIIDEFLDLDRDVEGGYLLLPFFAPPISVASLLPGFGADYRRLMGDYARLGLAVVMLHDRTAGRVEIDSSGQASITYHLSDEDRSDLIEGMRRLADVYFASGAQRVILPYNEAVELTRRGDYRLIDEHPFRANDPLLLSYHPQGTLRMGADPKRSVVDSNGEAHEVKRLFLADASVFPTSTAVPPQLSVMAFALRTAQYIARQA